MAARGRSENVTVWTLLEPVINFQRGARWLGYVAFDT